MVQISGSNNCEVRGNIVSGVEFFDLLFSNVGDVFSDSENGLSDEVISVRCVVDGFEGGLFLVSLVFDTLSVEVVSFGFDLLFVVDGVE